MTLPANKTGDYMETTLLLERLAAVAPQIAIETIWQYDHDEPWEGDWTKGEDQADWQCWQSEVRASAICAGQLIEGSAHLGGTWEKYGDCPSRTNPDISGYLPQMIDEALDELKLQCPKAGNTSRQITKAISLLKTEMRERYEAQRKEMACRDIATV